MLSADDLALVAALHGGFPLSDRPYAEMADRLGCSEDMLIERLQYLAYGLVQGLDDFAVFLQTAAVVVEQILDAVRDMLVVGPFPGPVRCREVQ